MTALAMYNLTAVDGLTSQFQLGTEINVDGATWRYIQANGVLAQYGAAQVQATGKAVALTTTTATNIVADIVIPQFAFADLEYGWAPVGPFFLREDGVSNFKVLAKTLDAVDVVQYTTASVGEVDDTSTVAVQGLVLLATNAAGATVATACRATRRLSVNS